MSGVRQQNGAREGQMDGWTDGRMDGWMIGWMIGWMDAKWLKLWEPEFFDI